MRKTEILEGVSVVEIPEAALTVLCGCPENAVKFLSKAGVIRWTERSGRRFETGPNAILLSEAPLQNGRFCNVAEFPVLQMLYRQGLIVPGHPNNDGTRPLLIGLRSQVEAIAAYIYLGNYGLTTASDIAGGGIDETAAAETLRMKLGFAFGKLRETKELIELRVLDNPIVELRGGAFLRRLAENRYEFIYGGEAVEVALRLPKGASYGAPYSLPPRSFERSPFAVVHLGEGDGWDAERPCMASLIVAGADLWLVDAGPNIEESLAALGLAMADLKGVFHTHAHDDHFVGLTALLRSERRLAYCALPCVRRATSRKLAALADIGEDEFGRYFEIRDLTDRAWNDFGSFEAYPLLSPHPVENSIFRFRARGSDRVFAHYADLTAFSVLDSLTKEDGAAPGISAAAAARSKADYLEPAYLKKVDVGGGMIHGDAADFRADPSPIVALSHTSPPLSAEVRRLGTVLSFGDVTPIVEGGGLCSAELASAILAKRLPSLPSGLLGGLGELVRPSGGELLLARGQAPEAVFLVVSGNVERSTPPDRSGLLAAGSIVGDSEARGGKAASADYRAREGLVALRIPAPRWEEAVGASGLGPAWAAIDETAEILASSAFLDLLPESAAVRGMAAASSFRDLADGEALDDGEEAIRVVVRGGAELKGPSGRVLEQLVPGSFFGEERVLSHGACLFEARAAGSCFVAVVPAKAFAECPALLWRLRESYERRTAAESAVFEFVWKPEFEMGVPTIDSAHRAIFDAIEALRGLIGAGAVPSGIRADADGSISELESIASEHFRDEEELMRKAAFPGLASHMREHRIFLEGLGSYRGSDLSARGASLSDLLKDSIVRHTLVVDRRYLPYLRRCGLA